MRDSRVEQLAATLVRYCTDSQPGERLLIVTSELAAPLALATYREALLVGAEPTLWPVFEDATRIYLDEASEEQLRRTPAVLQFAVETCDAYIGITAPANLKALTTVEPRRQVLANQARATIRDGILRKKWVSCYFPTPALAQEAGMSLDEYENFVFGATNIDWPATGESLQALKESLEPGEAIRIVGPDTDITVGVGGRIWIPDDGHRNMPGGEIFTSPVESATEGYVTFDFPAIHNGREVDGVRLEFRRGEVVSATATRGGEYLREMIASDAGARRLGEIGIGTNFGIRRFTKSILFDEKIGGTIHLALGRAYEQTGGTNQSSVHWDMIKDLRAGGEVYLDDRLILKDGQFV